MSPSTSNPDPMMPPMWAPAANTVLPVPGTGGHFSGGDPQMQQHAQSQAQISSLQQQNALLNQQLATQATSHIHQLQQFPHPSSSSPNPQVPTPSEPLQQPKAPPEVKTTNPLPFNPDEMVQKIRSDFQEEMMNTLKKCQDAHPPPTLATPPTPTMSSQPLLAPPGVPQPSNIPRTPVPDRRSRPPVQTRDYRM